MAVSLTRQEEQGPLSSSGDHQVNKLPQLAIRNLPILTPEHFQSGPVTGRTQTVYSCNSPGRETFWKENYERRQSQLSEGGFHGSPGHKYREVGNVELDDKTLILQGLGQMHLHQQDHHNTAQYPTTATAKTSTDTSDALTGRVCKSPILRARAASQLPDKLMKLQNELERADIQLDKIRKGSGLFDMFHKEKAKKESEKLRLKIEEENAKAREWLPPTQTNELQDEETSFIQENQTQSANEESSPDYKVSLAYSKLCTILWVLECMRLESPQHMQSLHSFWHTNRPPVNEEKGRRVLERTTALLKQYEQTITSDSHTQLTGPKNKDNKKQQKRPTSKQQQLKVEEGKIRKQRKLSPEQIEKLKQLIEEELNHTKKKSKNSLKQLMEEKALLNASPKKQQETPNMTTNIKLDASTIADNFNTVNETRDMIVHEQLSAMARDRQEAIEQRFSSLRVSGNMWIDLKRMRQGVEIETTAMASNKLMMNYDWLVELVNELPEEAFESRYCQELLIQLSSIQDYMRQVGPQVMSQEKLMSVLSLLRPWELQSTTVAQAVKFLITRVIYTVPDDYEAWLEYHTSKYNNQSTTTGHTNTQSE